MYHIDACTAPCELLLPKGMDHIEFDFDEHFSQPLMHFLDRCGIKVGVFNNAGRIIFPRKLFETPKLLKSQNRQLSDVDEKKNEDKKEMLRLFSTLADNRHSLLVKDVC